MKLNRFLSALPLLVFSMAVHGADATNSTSKITRVACVGDSITQGVGVKNQENDSYPAQLARLMGETWKITNYGVSGATMMNQGDHPYQKTGQFQSALRSKPDVVVIALGTNDSKPQNYEKHPDDFLASYREMVVRFREANPSIRIFVCLPVPAFPENWGIRESVISGKIIPDIKNIAAEENLFIINLHSALDGKSEFFPDKVHPNEDGAALMAKAVAAAISNDLSKGN